MNRVLVGRLASSPVAIALVVTLIYSIRFLYSLPFSGATRTLNQETANSLISYFIFSEEAFSFPLGVIKGLTFPFEDANIGNVGAIPLFALLFKALGKVIPYFRHFDYFVLIEIVACFTTAFFSQKILISLGVQRRALIFLGALLTATSFLILNRSAWLQPFCVAAFPIFAVWIYAMFLTLRRSSWLFAQDAAILSLFPIAALVDNYALFAILLGSGALLLREIYEVAFGNQSSSRSRLYRLLFFCTAGAGLSVFVLYLIGMFPLPPVADTFTSYDFGMGGRYHVADLFATWIPVANKVQGFVQPSLLGSVGFPFNTDQLGEGQYEGVAYVGTPVLLIWVSLALGWLFSRTKKSQHAPPLPKPAIGRFVCYSPWKKIGLAALAVFIFSLGYELHIYGEPFPNFTGMPAAWIADRFPSVYNIRATGRLASLLSLFLIFEAVRRLSYWYDGRATGQIAERTKPSRYLGVAAIAALIVIHILEIGPLLRPVSAQPLYPIGGAFSQADVDTLHRVAADFDTVLIAPSVKAVEIDWTVEAYSLAYYLGLRSNLYYLARTDPNHDSHMAKDLERISQGDWDSLIEDYGRVLFAIPTKISTGLRARMRDRYQEIQVGTISLWSRRDAASQVESQFKSGRQK